MSALSEGGRKPAEIKRTSKAQLKQRGFAIDPEPWRHAAKWAGVIVIALAAAYCVGAIVTGRLDPLIFAIERLGS